MPVAAPLLSIFAAWLAGCIAVWKIVPRTPGRIANIIGFGYLVGWLLATVVLRLGSWLGLWALSPILLLSLLALVTVIAFFLLRQVLGQFETPFSPQPHYSAGIPIYLALLLLSLATLATALAIAEVSHRPLFAWDAWQSWAVHAKVWFAKGHMVDFAGVREWMSSTPEASFFTVRPDHNLFVPLVMWWQATFAGSWDESAVALPWPLLGIATSALLFGQLRMANISHGTAIAVSALFLATPYVQTHMALAGYADPWLGAAILALGATMVHAADGRHRRALYLLAALAAMVGLQSKATAFIWIVVVVLGLVISRFRLKSVLPIAGLVAIGLTATLSISPLTIHIPYLLTRAYRIEYNHAWSTMVRTFFATPDWGLFWYLLLLLLCTAGRGVLPVGKRAAVVVTAGLLVTFVGIFVFTEKGEAAGIHANINRVLLHIAPFAYFVFGLFLTAEKTAATSPPVASIGETHDIEHPPIA